MVAQCNKYNLSLIFFKARWLHCTQLFEGVSGLAERPAASVLHQAATWTTGRLAPRCRTHTREETCRGMESVSTSHLRRPLLPGTRSPQAPAGPLIKPPVPRWSLRYQIAMKWHLSVLSTLMSSGLLIRPWTKAMLKHPMIMFKFLVVFLY